MNTDTKQREVGDMAVPLLYPQLASRIARIVPDHWTDRDIYILENGCVYDETEIE